MTRHLLTALVFAAFTSGSVASARPPRLQPRRLRRPRRRPHATARREETDDAVLDRSQPDFTLVNLPTSLRLPKYKSAFRVTHRFTRPLGQGDFGSLLEDFFGFDSGALIGLEYPLRADARRPGRHPAHQRSDDRVLRAVRREDAVGLVPARPAAYVSHRRHQQLPGQLLAGAWRGRVARDRRARARSTSSRSG